MVQWLRFPGSNTEGTGLIPDQETKTPHAVQCSQKKKNPLGIRVGRLSLSGCSRYMNLSPVFIQFWGCRVLEFPDKLSW